MTFLSAIVLLGILIFVHEFGHFLFAKLLKVKVLRFSLGFGPKVIGRTIGETEYRISAFPLGGYVKMLGEDPGEELPEADLSAAYSSQPVWKRFAIVFFGPIFNILFAALLLFLIFIRGVPYLLPEIGEVTKDSAAFRQGLQKGDTITGINGAAITKWDDMTTIIHGSAGKELMLAIKRGPTAFDLKITPEKKTLKDIFGQQKEVGLIGITPSGKTDVIKLGVAGTASIAIERTWDISVLTVMSVVKLIQRILPADTIGGPIMIFQMAGKQASQGATSFVMFMAIISINLGILNLLPIPILDGGHILFMCIEFVRGKPVSEKVIMTAQRIGLALLLSLMAFAFYNDITRLFTGKMY